jgi:FkbM family methyltransferase
MPDTRRPTLLESGLSFAFRMLPVKHGAHRLLDRLVPRAWVKGSFNVAVPYRGGTLRIDVSDLVGWHFLVMRSFDPEISEVLLSFADLAGEEVFWDIGANKGVLSYAMAAALPRARIVAIEPQSGLREPLKANLETLAHGRHEVFTVALGDQPGRLELIIPPHNRGQASLVAARSPGSLVEQVEVVTADALRMRSSYDWPTMVKIDVEGFEPTVVRSLREAFRSRRVRVCVFECHRSQETAFKQIREVTQPCGYLLYAIRKTPFSTRLVPTAMLARAVTDYALIRDDLRVGSAGSPA